MRVKVYRHQLQDMLLTLNALLKSWTPLIGGKGHCRYWAGRLMNWDREAVTNPEMRRLLEELPLGVGQRPGRYFETPLKWLEIHQ